MPMATTYLGRFQTSLSRCNFGYQMASDGATTKTLDQRKNPTMVMMAPAEARWYMYQKWMAAPR